MSHVVLRCACGYENDPDNWPHETKQAKYGRAKLTIGVRYVCPKCKSTQGKGAEPAQIRLPW